MQTNAINFSPDVRPPLETAKPAVQRTPEPPKPAVEHKIDTEELARLQSALADNNISLRFSQDDATDRIVVQMIDENTGEAIRQFPTEVSLHLAANFMRLQGVFIDAE